MVRYKKNSYVGVLEKDKVYVIEQFTSMIRFIELFPYLKLKEILSESVKKNISDIELLQPIKKARHDIICVGKNYKEHVKEVLEELDGQSEKPSYFSKRADTILGDKDKLNIRIDLDDKLDYEAELAVVIGKKALNVDEENAIEYIFGYSVFNDISLRQLQKDHNQWFRGKSLNGCSVMGPCIVTKDELDYNDLKITSYVDGELRQSDNTNNMIYKIPMVISELSQGMTLYPGDIITTGTPKGVGMSFNPHRFLKKGSIVECNIQGIGSIVNEIV